jgi:hypothetical protein
MREQRSTQRIGSRGSALVIKQLRRAAAPKQRRQFGIGGGNIRRARRQEATLCKRGQAGRGGSGIGCAPSGRAQLGDDFTTIGDEHTFAQPDPAHVVAQTILQLSKADNSHNGAASNSTRNRSFTM